MALFHRARMKKICPTIRQRDADEGHQFWNSALAGFSSLRSGVLRALKLENGAMRGASFVHFRWGMAKFYDPVDGPRLLCSCSPKGP